MENSSHSLKETNFVLQLIQESQIKSKTLISWSSWQTKKRAFFVPFILFEENFFKICVLLQRVVYWIYFQNIQTFTYQKTLLCILLLFAFKKVESFQCILKWRFNPSKRLRSCYTKLKHFKEGRWENRWLS